MSVEQSPVVRDLQSYPHGTVIAGGGISSGPSPDAEGDRLPTIRVVLVEPKYGGNVGAVARAMANFGVEDLVLVGPVALDEEASRRAMHGRGILQAARIVPDLDAALREVDFVAGTSGITTESEKRFARISVTPRELAERIATIEGTVAVLFGREDFGLLDEELRRCDLLVTIPASSDYPILNISHAAAILLYEVCSPKAPSRQLRKASGFEKEKLYEVFRAFLDASDYPPHKRGRTETLFRRLLGRAVPSKWEFHALMGVFQGATKRILRLRGKP